MSLLTQLPVALYTPRAWPVVSPLMSAQRMFRMVFCLVAMYFLPAAQAQDDEESLTEEFAHMSAKERARIAKKEQEEARGDPAYQGAMARAEDHFQHARYEDALASYREARTLRPLNVYPKVKIKDLKALIAQREAARSPEAGSEVAAQETAAESPPDVPLAPQEEQPAAQEPPLQKALPAASPGERPGERTGTVERRSAKPRVPKQVTVPEAKPQAPDGMMEKRYKEGNAEVVERAVTSNGRTTIFKRVSHPWGQVFYFEDGQPIDPRVWKQHFND